MYVLIQQAPIRWPEKEKHGISMSEEAKDLISKLLHKERKMRFGSKKGADEVLSHPFFTGIDLIKLEKKEIEPEFKPQVDKTGLNNFDQSLKQTQESIISNETMKKIQKEEETLSHFGFGKDPS